MSSINSGTINNAAKGDQEAMRTLLNAFSSQISALAVGTGVQLLEPTSGGKTQTPVTSTPGLASLSVSGANGVYALSITNPMQTIASTIYHQVQYSTTSNFTNPTTVGIAPTTNLTLSMPDTTLYWRLRSSYDQSNFNAWTPAQGNPAVAAGLQSSAATANANVLNQTNYASVDSVDNGAGSANVRVYGKSGVGFMYPAVKGAAQTVLPSATIIGVPFSSSQVVAHDGTSYQAQPTLPQVLSDPMTPTGSVSVVGSGAVMLPVVVPIETGGAIVGYNVTDQGNGLTADVTITIVGTGTGATAGTQTRMGGKLISVAAGNAGSGYGSGTTTTISGGVSPGTLGGGQDLGGNGGRLVYNDGTTA